MTKESDTPRTVGISIEEVKKLLLDYDAGDDSDDGYVNSLIAESCLVSRGIPIARLCLKQDNELNQALLDRDRAVADARILAHAYEHDTRPPTDVVQRALKGRKG